MRRQKPAQQEIDGMTKRQAQKWVWDREVEVNNRRIDLERVEAYGGWTGNQEWELNRALELLAEAQAFLAQFA